MPCVAKHTGHKTCIALTQMIHHDVQKCCRTSGGPPLQAVLCSDVQLPAMSNSLFSATMNLQHCELMSPCPCLCSCPCPCLCQLQPHSWISLPPLCPLPFPLLLSRMSRVFTSLVSCYALGAVLTVFCLLGDGIAAGSAGCLGTWAYWAAQRCARAIQSMTCKQVSLHCKQVKSS